MCGNPCRCGVGAGELPAAWLQMNCSFSHSLLQFTIHSPGVMQSLRVSEQGRLKPRLFDTSLAFLTVPLFLTSSVHTSGISTEQLSKYQRAAREGEDYWSPGHADILREDMRSQKLDWLCSSLELFYHCPTFSICTPFPSVQPQLSRWSCDMEWPS